MSLHNIHEAKSQLSKLIEQAELGKEVIIVKAGKPVVKLVPYQSIAGKRKGGQWQGKIKIKPGFGKLPNDIAAAFGIE